MKRFLLVFFSLVALIFSNNASSDIGNISGSSVTVTGGDGFNNAVQIGFVFSTGPSSTQISDISLAFTSLTTSTTASFTLELWNASAGQPTSQVAGASVSGLSLTTGIYTLGRVNTYSGNALGGISSASLSPNSQYAIILKSSNNGNAWAANISPASYVTSNGMSYVGSLFSVNGGSSYGSYNPVAISITGTVSPTPASIPSLSEWTQLLLALMVMTVIGWHFHRERSY